MSRASFLKVLTFRHRWNLAYSFSLSYDLHSRKSQIQTYLEQNEGAGLQHLALKTDDIFDTLTKMREAEEDFSGFDLMKRPSDEYYRELPERLGDKLTVSLGDRCI
jgi:4-hydroxyphenylpyruvate dioxygenase-like putative hemolysin